MTSSQKGKNWTTYTIPKKKKLVDTIAIKKFWTLMSSCCHTF
jgi:hypothetical protein